MGSDMGGVREWNEWSANIPGDAADLGPGCFGSPYACLACRAQHSAFPMPAVPLSIILSPTKTKPQLAPHPVLPHALSCTMRRFASRPQTPLFRADQYGWIRDALFDSQRSKLVSDVDAISLTNTHARLDDVGGGAASICSSLLGDVGEVLMQMCANQLFDWNWGESEGAGNRGHGSAKAVSTEHSSGMVLVRHSHRQILSGGGDDDLTGTSVSQRIRTEWRSRFDTPLAILYWLLGSTHVGAATAAAAPSPAAATLANH